MHEQRQRRAGAALVLMLAVCLAHGALAQQMPSQAPPPEGGWGYALANELMSPWCPGFALPDCASGYASDLRLWILEQERLGRSEEEVRGEILAKYGEKMLQAPRAEGRGILAYAIPAAGILVGLAVLVMFLRKQGRRKSGVENPGPNAQAIQGTHPDALARVDAELASFDSAND